MAFYENVIFALSANAALLAGEIHVKATSAPCVQPRKFNSLYIFSVLKSLFSEGFVIRVGNQCKHSKHNHQRQFERHFRFGIVALKLELDKRFIC